MLDNIVLLQPRVCTLTGQWYRPITAFVIFIQVLFFCISLTLGPEQVKDREYLGTVNAIYLNADYAAVLFEGKVQLHLASTRHIDSSQNRGDLRTHSY